MLVLDVAKDDSDSLDHLVRQDSEGLLFIRHLLMNSLLQGFDDALSVARATSKDDVLGHLHSKLNRLDLEQRPHDQVIQVHGLLLCVKLLVTLFGLDGGELAKLDFLDVGWSADLYFLRGLLLHVKQNVVCQVLWISYQLIF